MAIHKLPPDIINKIAAGEVVERPASVVKELVENALDAGATNIEIEIKNGGKNYIRIQDNGCGMSESDLNMAIEQHATSKITDLNDLFNINTFGFRGEALASISSVSDFLLTTTTDYADNNVGFLLKVINNEKTIVPAACKKGTKIEVKNLFKNIPARREYLKGQATEYNHILDVFTQFALINPSVHFVLIHNDKQVYNLQPVDDILNRAEILFNKDITDSLVLCKQKLENFNLNGYIGKAHMFYNNRNYQYIFINGRYIKSPVIAKAILQGYGSQIPRGMYPVYVLDLKIDPKKVDVNVHPRKLEVRFSDSQSVFRFIVNSVKQTLQVAVAHKPITSMQNNRIWNEERGMRNEVRGMIVPGPSSPVPHPSFPIPRSNNTLFNNFDNDNNQQLENLRLIGQVKDSYILVEDFEKGLLIIDQHAADERVNYERIKREYDHGKKTKKQILMIPIHIELSLKEFNIVMEHKDDFDSFGFEIDEFGDKTIIVNSVPTIIRQKDPKKVLQEIISDIVEGKEANSYTIDYLLKTISCKSAIKFGDKLSIDEQLKLLKDIQHIENKMACAHGRPFVLELTYKEINNMFER